MNIGDKIRTLRKENKITQEQLAEYLGVSPQAVSKWETGLSYPDIETLPGLAVYFRVSIDELLDYNEKKIQEDVDRIIDESFEYRKTDRAKCESIYREGLKRYPNNEVLLNCLLMVIPNDRSAEKAEIGERLIEVTKDDEIKYDVIRILAQMYHSIGEDAMAEYYLNMMPEFYFLKNNIAAFCYSGERQMEEIKKAENVSVGILMEMLEFRKRMSKSEEERRKYEDIGVTILNFYNGLCYSPEITKRQIERFLDGKYMDCFLD